MDRSAANVRIGLLLGLLGVVCFSLTLPATRIAVPQLGAIVVALGRALVAAALAGGLLALRREPLPISHVRALIATGLGVVVGFPLFSAMALTTVPAIHGAVIVGFTPAATAVFATVRDRERPSLGFWIASALGLIAIVLFAEVQGAGALRPPDLLLLLAVASAAFGYVEGARVARDIGGWRTICWALVLTAPVLTIPVGLEVVRHGEPHASLPGWIGFAYVAIVSMFLGFFAWYAGLARGGTARVSQLQLLQLPLTVLWGILFLHESVGVGTIALACVVVASAAAAVRFRAGKERTTMLDRLPENFRNNEDVKYGMLRVVDIPSEATANVPWFNQTLTTVNEAVVRLGLFQGDFPWHKHVDQDEFFLVLEGEMSLDVEGREPVVLRQHEGYTVPKGTMHRPRSPQRSVVLMVESLGIVPTGTVTETPG